MRFGFVSDIHSNLEAFQAVLADLEDKSVDQLICLGDVVGYGPRPNECVELVREKIDYTILGNHDAGAIGKTDIQHFNFYARQAIEWTREVLTPENYRTLSELPMKIILDDMTFVHATPEHPEEWDYLVDSQDAEPSFDAFRTHLCFIGHSHVPVAFCKEGTRLWSIRDQQLLIQPEIRYIINVGSVGQPRDGDPRACYGVFDAQTALFEYFRVPYDIAATQKDMQRAGLPDFLIRRLTAGR